MKQTLQQKMTQGPVMTPDLRQAIQLLSMPIQDLSTFVENELMENPFLQKEDGTEEGEFERKSEHEKDSAEAMEGNSMGEANQDDFPLDYKWDNMYDGGDAPTSGGTNNFSGNSDELAYWERTASEEKTLQQHLMEQLLHVVDNHTDQFLGQYVIDAIDDAGYLRMDIKDAAKRLSVEQERLEDIVAIVQTFDPVGIGARDLAECLRLQMHVADNLTDAAEVVLQHLDLLAKQDFDKLAKLAKTDKIEILEAAEDIATCNPKPGLAFSSSSVDAVIPDVIVQQKNGELVADLNAAALPKVLVNQVSSAQFANATGENKSYVGERISRAQWLIKSLEQRARTILKVSRAIVQAQEDFFTYGVESLKPMTLKQIADIVEVHESTVSRVTNGKFMQTPMGTFELKHFFSAAINTTGGNTEVAASSVKAIIKRLVDGEDARKPLSDEKLVTLLKEEGVDIARRTVAKYREALGIPSSSGRRIK